MMNRLLGFLLAASMAHLVAAGSDLGCATHSEHAVAREAPASMPGMPHHGDAGQTGKEGCNVPTRGDCCDRMTSCAVNVALTSLAGDDPPLHQDGGVAAFVADAPLTRIVSPDPPPPKA